MRAIITGCSCVISMDLTVCHKQIEEKWELVEISFQFTNGESKNEKILPTAASFGSLVHLRPHTFHFVYTFHSTFDDHDTHSFRYDAMNELKAGKTLVQTVDQYFRILLKIQFTIDAS